MTGRPRLAARPARGPAGGLPGGPGSESVSTGIGPYSSSGSGAKLDHDLPLRLHTCPGPDRRASGRATIPGPAASHIMYHESGTLGHSAAI